MTTTGKTTGPWLSIGIIAWNEAEAIGAALESLFQQTVFAELAARGQRAEILCLANGCTDATVTIAAQQFRKFGLGRVIELPQRGKINAWNRFVHHESARNAELLVLMDADILLHTPATLWNMCRTLLDNPDAAIATDEPIKDIALKPRKSWRDRLSLATSRMTHDAPGQLTGQLYCIRAAEARRLFLPHDLAACEDGFIKSVVTGPRIVTAPDAAHVFQAYTAVGDILRNQKRQMIGQAIVHVLVDQFLAGTDRQKFAELLRSREELDPAWLQRLIAEHLWRSRYFWRLFPNALSFRWTRWRQNGARLGSLPATLLGFGVTLFACWQARRLLRRGTLSYWPETKSPLLKQLTPSWKQNTTSA